MRRRASSGSNHSARSTSGTSCHWPDPGGHCTRHVLLWIVRRIAIPFEGPGVDDLPALLPDAAERTERALRTDAGLLLELAARRGQLVFALRQLALGDRPHARVLLRPEGAAGMDEQDLQPAATPAEHQEPGAGARHAQRYAKSTRRLAYRGLVA